MAMSKLSKTMILITENEPNIKSPENRVNSLIPVNSKLSKSTKPKMAQNKVWTVSQRLWGGKKYHHWLKNWMKMIKYIFFVVLVTQFSFLQICTILHCFDYFSVGGWLRGKMFWHLENWLCTKQLEYEKVCWCYEMINVFIVTLINT